MQKVTIGEIQKTIYENRTELISSFLAEGRTEIPYTLKNFETDMLVTELLVDARTIRTKWKLLTAAGTIREVSEKSHRGYLSIDALRPYMSTPMAHALTLAERGGERVRETHIGAWE